jgi:2'-5' RNA ligase
MRCFIAIKLPEHVHGHLKRLQRRLANLDRNVRWTKPEQIHLTLKFLGEVPDDQVADLCAAAADAVAPTPRVDLEIAGTGCFPPRGPARVLWVGVQGPPPALIDCYVRLEQALARLGYPPETRPFKPHLTLGRVRKHRPDRGVRPAVEAESGFHIPVFEAGKAVFYQSILGPKGPTYIPIFELPFSG